MTQHMDRLRRATPCFILVVTDFAATGRGVWVTRRVRLGFRFGKPGRAFAAGKPDACR